MSSMDALLWLMSDLPEAGHQGKRLKYCVIYTFPGTRSVLNPEIDSVHIKQFVLIRGSQRSLLLFPPHKVFGIYRK